VENPILTQIKIYFSKGILQKEGGSGSPQSKGNSGRLGGIMQEEILECT
jgi:hypothetical protein